MVGACERMVCSQETLTSVICSLTSLALSRRDLWSGMRCVMIGFRCFTAKRALHPRDILGKFARFDWYGK
jgi:hypothetical protein